MARDPLGFHQPHAVHELGRCLAMLEHHPLIAAWRLARDGVNERLSWRKTAIPEQAPRFPKIGVDGAVAGVKQRSHVVKMTIFLVIQIGIDTSGGVAHAWV